MVSGVNEWSRSSFSSWLRLNGWPAPNGGAGGERRKARARAGPHPQGRNAVEDPAGGRVANRRAGPRMRPPDPTVGGRRDRSGRREPLPPGNTRSSRPSGGRVFPDLARHDLAAATDPIVKKRGESHEREVKGQRHRRSRIRDRAAAAGGYACCGGAALIWSCKLEMLSITASYLGGSPKIMPDIAA